MAGYVMQAVKEDYESAIHEIWGIVEQINDLIFDFNLETPENALLLMPHAVQIWKTFYGL
jgi:hypothetical protein